MTEMISNLQSTTDDGGRDDGSLTFNQPADDEGRVTASTAT